MFCFTAKTLLNEVKKYRPDIASACLKTFASFPKSRGESSSQVEISPKLFAHVPEESLDYAVMEKSKNAAVVSSDIGWSDIGSWNAMETLIKADKNGNRVKGKAVLLDAKNCHIQTDGRTVAAIGIKDIIVIDTSDALLVAAKRRAQDVKEVYSRLKSQGSEIHRLHRTVYRPWGTYTILEEGPDFKIKRIEVLPHRRLSLQLHNQRSEHWVILHGHATIQRGEKIITLSANESTFIPPKTKHRLANKGKTPLVMIEVQCGSYLGEDDIVRFQDEYGRS
jgi:mannose-1-phosphate guanylyltransferase